MEKKISVVVPTYRRPQLLEKCLIALSKQHMNRDDYEIIIVSDGPDDDTRNMLHGLQHVILPYVQYVTLPKNSGPAAARNAGWKKAQGQLIAFTDDDCCPGPGWLSRLWKTYLEHGTPQLMAFSGRIIVPISEAPTDFELNTSLLERAEFVTANCACTHDALLLTGGFDERFKVAWREDSDLEFKLLERDIPIKKVNDAIVVHPVRRAQWGVSIKEQRKSMFNALLYKKYPQLFREKIQPAPAWNYYLIILGCIMMVAGWMFNNKAILVTGGTLYITLTAAFTVKRLTQTSRSYDHVMEMIATSLIIPFLSIYWTLYGSFKYRVLFY
jgi:GT2 family glycosyltransferase